ncbi:ATP-grasp domain-containing protein [Enterobacteriaceae bacterium LUAb1]
MIATTWHNLYTLENEFIKEKAYLKRIADDLKKKTIILIEGAHSEENLVYKESAPDEERGIVSIEREFQNKGYRFHRVLSTDKRLKDFLAIADIAFIYAHGEYGEDGRIQGWLDYINVKYPGSGLSASAICCDKLHFKHIVKGAGLPTPDFFEINNDDSSTQLRYKVEKLGYPIMIKHRRGGSSLGITLIENEFSLSEWENNTPVTDRGNYFGESYIDGDFVTLGVINIDRKYYILPYLRAQTSTKFYDAATKLGNENCEVFFTLNEGFSMEVVNTLEVLAKNAFLSTGCEGIARVDIMICRGNPYLLEINTIPGISPNSNFTKMFTHFGFTYEDLLVAVMNTANLKEKNHTMVK